MNVRPLLSWSFVLLLPWKCQFIKYAFVGPGRLCVQMFSATVETVAAASTRQGQCSCLVWTNIHGFLSTWFRPDIALHFICSSYSRSVFRCIPPSDVTTCAATVLTGPRLCCVYTRRCFQCLETPYAYCEGLDCGDHINRYQLIEQPSKKSSLLSTENQAKANCEIQHVSCWFTPWGILYSLFCFHDNIKSCCSACLHCWGPTF